MGSAKGVQVMHARRNMAQFAEWQQLEIKDHLKLAEYARELGPGKLASLAQAKFLHAVTRR